MSIWAKITAGLGAVIAFLLALLRFKSKKVDELQQQVDTFEIKDEINEYMEEVEVSEKIRLEEEIERKAQTVRSAGHEELNSRIDDL